MSETAEAPIDAPIDPIVLSHFTSALLDNLKAIKPRIKPDDVSKIHVSQTVSLVALIYEKSAMLLSIAKTILSAVPQLSASLNDVSC